VKNEDGGLAGRHGGWGGVSDDRNLRETLKRNGRRQPGRGEESLHRLLVSPQRG